MKKYIFLTLVFLVLFSCTKILGTLYGLTDPNEKKTDLEVFQYIDEIKLEKQNNYRPKDEISYKKITKLFDNSITEAIIFDKNGYGILYKEKGVECNAGLEKFLPSLTINTKLIKEDLNYSEILKEVKKIDSKEIEQFFQDYDYLLVINWATFMGRVNKEKTLHWEKLAKDNKNCKIKIIKINMDLQDSWE